jgi:3-oxoacyl-[acyl-carrier protein] reductase
MSRVVVVTGAGRGIGRAVVEHFAAEDGCEVIAADVVETGLTDTVAATEGSPGRVHPLVADVSTPEGAERLVERAEEGLGDVEVLVNNAAVSLGESFLETSMATWERTIAVNQTGPFLCSQAVARQMVRTGTRGRIVNMASINGVAAERGTCAYVATKGAVLALTRAMAVDLAPHGIRVNAVAPGPVRTEHNAELFDEPSYASGIRRGVPMGRAGTPQEVAAVVGMLSSDTLTYMTGATIVVDGGYLGYARLD